MGKKKVKISNEPLNPTTIGQINTHKFGWILTLLIVALFVGVVYYLPELSKVYVDGTLDLTPIYKILESWGIDLNTPSIIIPINETNITNETKQNTKLLFGNNTEVTIQNIKFSSIEYKNQNETFYNEETQSEETKIIYKLSFVMENLLDESINMGDMGYYLELYNNDTLIDSFDISQTLSAKEQMDMSATLNEEANMFLFNIKNNQEETLSCNKDEQKIIYTFDENGLKSIDEENIIYSSNEQYTTYYDNLKNNSNENVSVVINELENGFYYKYIIYYNDNYLKGDKPEYFEKGVSKLEIKTYMENKEFSCE